MSEPKPEVETQPTLIADSERSEPMNSAVLPAQMRIAGRYEVLGLLGEGGMGTVYRARDSELDDVVALKMLRHELVKSPAMLERFRREVKLARRVTHRNVARAFDIGEHEGERFLTMEYIDGDSLSVVVVREGRLSIARVVSIGTAICEGLAAAHDAGVIHRDLKPDNVMVAKDGRVVITDFGIARGFEPGDAQKTQGLALGTPAYMAPEQVEGSTSIDARADVYALGAMLFELFTGQPAWKGDSPYAVAAARLVLPPPDPRERSSRVSNDAAELILRCMARLPADRFATARDVAAALAKLSLEHTMQVPSSGPLSLVHPTPAQASATQIGDKTVAVVPFTNVGAADDAYLAAGLTEDLVDLLSMSKGLRVKPRGVVEALAANTRDVIAIGRELGVHVVVEGSVRKNGPMMRISTRVLSVADGFQLWAKRFDRATADLFAVSDEVAQAVAEALTVQPAQNAREAPTDPAALELFLRARHEYHKFEMHSVMRAIELFDRAIELAPNDVPILTGGALARVRLWFFGGEGSAEQAMKLAEKAMSISPNRAESLLALAAVRFQDNHVVEAVGLARRALVISPAMADAHELLGRVLSETGPADLAIQSMTTAIRLDPGFSQAKWAIARVQALLGSWKEATRSMLESVNAGSSPVGAAWSQLARLIYWHGNAEMARSLLAERGEEIARASPLGFAIFQQVLTPEDMGDPFQAFPLALNANRASWRGRSFLGQARAEFAMGAGKHDVAIDAIEGAVEGGLIDVLWLEHCPLLAPIREDARMIALRKTVKDRTEEIRRAFHS